MPQPRRKLQLHLSTAILLMLTAGLILWANMRNGYDSLPEMIDTLNNGRYGSFVPDHLVAPDEMLMKFAPSPYDHEPLRTYGWPLSGAVECEIRKFDPFEILRQSRMRKKGIAPLINLDGWEFYYSKIALDFATAALILVAIWYISEWRIRRKTKSMTNDN